MMSAEKERIEKPDSLEQRLEQRATLKEKRVPYEVMSVALVLDFHGLPIEQREKILMYYLWELKGDLSLVETYYRDTSDISQRNVISVIYEEEIFNGYLKAESTLRSLNHIIQTKDTNRIRVQRLKMELSKMGR